MSVRRLAKQQPESFTFSADSEKEIAFWLAKYPEARKASAVIPLLWIVQKQEGWVPEPALRAVAERLDMAYIRVYEVVTFYTMFNLAPVGEHLIQVCGTTPCMLRGSGDLIKVCKSRIGEAGAISADGKFTWLEVECMGACANAPMFQLANKDGDHYVEDLDAAKFEQILDDLAAGKAIKYGPQSDRVSSEAHGTTVLTDPSLYDGSRAKPINLPNTGSAKPAAPAAKPEPAAKPAPAPKPAAATKPVSKTKPKPAPKVKAEPAAATSGGKAPKTLKKAKGQPDDLKRLSGVGPKLEQTLNELGFFHFAQIAQWGPEEIAWVDSRLKFKGRIEREGWVAQAKALAEGA
ncbi:NADH-quinone oxidoreductase subunit NuoE [Maricaulis sp.]|uniref:NADH-quinone oxidoreductase subunit NuoE n=1 Tax=Maricaulis sp. TaxID=1486257 RepID=UPI003A8E4423